MKRCYRGSDEGDDFWIREGWVKKTSQIAGGNHYKLKKSIPQSLNGKKKIENSISNNSKFHSYAED